jgi:hypothetical protein
MTNRDVVNEIVSVINSMGDYYDDETEHYAKLHNEELMLNPDEVYVTCEELDEYDEPSYLYFGVINPVVINGITFLNP